MKLIQDTKPFLEAILSLLILLRDAQCTEAKESATTPPVNIANFQKLASLSPAELHQTFRYLENPYIATALVERDRNVKEKLVTGSLPPVFNEPGENSELQNQVMRKNMGRRINLEEILKDPILGPYFNGHAEEDSTSVKLKL